MRLVEEMPFRAGWGSRFFLQYAYSNSRKYRKWKDNADKDVGETLWLVTSFRTGRL